MANRTMFGGLQSYAETLKFDDKAVVEVYQSGRKMTYRIFAGIPYDTTHILYYHDFTDEQVFTDFFAALDKAATDKSYSGSDHKNGFAPSPAASTSTATICPSGATRCWSCPCARTAMTPTAIW